MRLSYKFHIKANKETLAKAERWLDICRWLYNDALAQRIMWYKQGKRRISCYDQCHQLVEAKKEHPEYKEVNAQTLKDVLRRLDRAYDNFFRRVKEGRGKAGFPRFKAKHRYDSFTLVLSGHPNGWKLDGKYLRVTNLGVFKLYGLRPIEGGIKTVTIRRSPSGKWFACFSCDDVPARLQEPSDKVIGLDVGIKSFVVDSEGHRVVYPKFLRTAERLLRMRQRRLSRRKKGSRRRNKARILVAKAHETVENRRNDWLHKVANDYVSKYGKIVVEDLNIKGMVRNHCLAKSINDSSWGRFFQLLSYKAEEAGRELIKVNPRGTSQICSGCGEKVEKTLAVRIHACPYCGLVMDRDENAARNIVSRGRHPLQALTLEEAPCVA